MSELTTFWSCLTDGNVPCWEQPVADGAAIMFWPATSESAAKVSGDKDESLIPIEVAGGEWSGKYVLSVRWNELLAASSEFPINVSDVASDSAERIPLMFLRRKLESIRARNAALNAAVAAEAPEELPNLVCPPIPMLLGELCPELEKPEDAFRDAVSASLGVKRDAYDRQYRECEKVSEKIFELSERMGGPNALLQAYARSVTGGETFPELSELDRLRGSVGTEPRLSDRVQPSVTDIDHKTVETSVTKAACNLWSCEIGKRTEIDVSSRAERKQHRHVRQYVTLRRFVEQGTEDAAEDSGPKHITDLQRYVSECCGRSWLTKVGSIDCKGEEVWVPLHVIAADYGVTRGSAASLAELRAAIEECSHLMLHIDNGEVREKRNDYTASDWSTPLVQMNGVIDAYYVDEQHPSECVIRLAGPGAVVEEAERLGQVVRYDRRRLDGISKTTRIDRATLRRVINERIERSRRMGLTECTVSFVPYRKGGKMHPGLYERLGVSKKDSRARKRVRDGVVTVLEELQSAEGEGRPVVRNSVTFEKGRGRAHEIKTVSWRLAPTDDSAPTG